MAQLTSVNVSDYQTNRATVFHLDRGPDLKDSSKWMLDHLEMVLREKNTRNYLIAYTVFNTVAHVAAISTVYSLDPDFDGEEAGTVDKVGKIFGLSEVSDVGIQRCLRRRDVCSNISSFNRLITTTAIKTFL